MSAKPPAKPPAKPSTPTSSGATIIVHKSDAETTFMALGAEAAKVEAKLDGLRRLPPNARETRFVTAGVARRLNLMEIEGDVTPYGVPPTGQGGGDLNGSANTAHLMGQAGTAGSRIALPRQAQPNYCGIV